LSKPKRKTSATNGRHVPPDTFYHRDYTRRRPESPHKVPVFRQGACDLASKVLSFVEDKDLRDTLIKLLSNEYFSDNFLYQKHKKETEE
jgi:hypothetical protein